MIGARGLALAGALVLSACASTSPSGPGPSVRSTGPPPIAVRYADTGYGKLPGWHGDSQAAALPALALSCAQIAGLPETATLGPDRLGARAGDWAEPCAALKEVAPGDDRAARAYMERWFRPVAINVEDDPVGVFTGYYEVAVKAARTRRPGFTEPLYGKPRDLVSLGGSTGRMVSGMLKPYYSRAEIDRGALGGRHLEIAWLADKADVFLVQVQGSARLDLVEGGGTMRIGVAGTNGLTYHAIGDDLVARGVLTKSAVTMPAILAWLKSHPSEGAVVMALNPRYVFFREISGTGPLGAEGVALTPGRSIAVDPSIVPLGAPVWIDTLWPDDPEKPLQRLVVAQDIGGAIKGPARADLYWGTGDGALAMAGRMKSPGRYAVLLPEAAARRLP